MTRVDIAYNLKPSRPSREKGPQIDVNALLAVVTKVFRQIEPWSYASSDDGTIDLIIKSTQIQGLKFGEAIDLSVATSDDGLMLLAEGVLFTRATAQGKLMEDLQPDFGSLIRRANDGCQRVERSFEMLGEVSGKFEEMSRSTGPVVLQGIMRGAGRKRKRTQVAPDIHSVARAMGQVMMASGRVSTLVTMPVPLPEPTKAALGVNGVYQVPPKRRKTENLAVPESLSRLEVLANDIADIRMHMSRFIGLWKDIEDRLTRMQSLVGRGGLAVDEFDQEVENDWAEVATQYKAYRDQMTKIREYYQLNFDLDFKEVGFKAKLTELEKDVHKMKKATQLTEDIMRLTHSGEGRVQFQHSVDVVYEGLQGEITRLISLLEGFERELQRSGGVSDTDPMTRAKLRDLLEQTETEMPTVSLNIQKLEKLLAEQVSKKRLVRAQLYHARDWFSLNTTAPKVFSQEEAACVLEDFELGVLGLSRFCEILVLVGIQLDEAVLFGDLGDGTGSAQLEQTLHTAIAALRLMEGEVSRRYLDIISDASVPVEEYVEERGTKGIS